MNHSLRYGGSLLVRTSILTIAFFVCGNTGEWRRGAVGRGVKSPLMSFVGLGPQFHTPADVPADVTSPDSLGTVYGSIGEAIDRVVEPRAAEERS